MRCFLLGKPLSLLRFRRIVAYQGLMRTTVQKQHPRDRPRISLPPSYQKQQLRLPEPGHPIAPQRSSELQRRANLNLQPPPAALPPRRRLPRIPLRLDALANFLLRRRRLSRQLRPIRPRRTRHTDAEPLEQRRSELERRPTGLKRRIDGQLHKSVLQHEQRDADTTMGQCVRE